MILSDNAIKAAREAGDIVITPFNPKALGSNSYDVHLAKTLKTYHPKRDVYDDIMPLSTRRPTPTATIEIGPRGFILRPGTLYLGATQEYTETRKYVPFVDGKSSIGRLGITIHCTAGRGDVGFKGHWTLEIHVVEPVEVFEGDPIGQLIFFETGEVDVPYDTKIGAKYNNTSPIPQESMMWKNFEPGGKYHRP